MMMYSYAATLLVLLSLWTLGEPAPLCPGMTNDAYQILLDVLETVEIKEEDLKGSCVPVYRLDLPKTYVAYQVVFTKKEFIITSAGKKTCDRDLIAQSEVTSPIKVMDKAAKKNNAKCDRYYLLSDAVDMVCKDADGKTVGSTFDKNTLKDILEKFGSLDKYLDDRSKALKKYFKERCKELDERNNDKPPEGRGGEEVIEEEGLNAGATKVIALKSAPKKVIIKYLNEKQNATGEEKAAGLKQVCGDIKGCSVKGSFGVLASSQIKTNPDRLKLKISKDAEENSFEVEIKYKGGKKEQYYFGILKSQPEKRGWYQYTSWTSFTYCYIRNYGHYPNYCPFMWGRCFSGTGAMAWAHVFAFCDRRGSCPCLYKGGYNGYTGSCSQVAPYSRDTRMTYYANYLKGVILEDCYGNTNDNNMLRVRSYFAQNCYNRQIYSATSNLDAWVYAYVCGGRPVIVRRRTAYWYSYASALGVRRRYYSRRYCRRYIFWTRCDSWRTYYDYDYYLTDNHCGGRGWYNMASYWAAVAAC